MYLTNIVLMPWNDHACSFFPILCFEEERRLDIDEKPLVVQLNWNKDDREGRFVLKNENDAIPAKVGTVPVSDASFSPGLDPWNGQVYVLSWELLYAFFL